jgi:alanine dehydrogenase
MPGPRASTFALNNATLPFARFADLGWQAALRADPH